MRLTLVCLGLLFAATTAHGGAWVREKGQIFIATAANLCASDRDDEGMHYDPTFYLEYGLSELVTVGLDYFTTDNDTVHTGFVFAQFPLGDVTGRNRFAINFGYGAQTDFVLEFDQLLHGGLSWGYGLDNGWLAIDVSATYSKHDQIFRPKADFTYGHNLTDRRTVMSQLQTGDNGFENRYAQIKSGFIYGFSDNTRGSLQATSSIVGDAPSALRIEIWQTY